MALLLPLDPLRSQGSAHMSSPVALPTSTVRRVQSVISGENSTWSFRCDEEPHMLGAERGPLGYYPLQLPGHVFQHDRLDVKCSQTRLGSKLERLAGQSSQVRLPTIFYKSTSQPHSLAGYHSEERYVAIKILTVNASFGVRYGHYHEFGVYMRIRKFQLANGESHPGLQHCPIPESTMEQKSVRGVHVCNISEPCGSTVAELQHMQPDGRLPLPVVKNIARQTLLALDFLHGLQVIHGDLKPNNLFIHLPVGTVEIANYLRDNPSETYPPRYEPSIWDGPIITVKTQPLPNLGLLPSLENLSIRLGDFGGDKISPNTLIATPGLLQAPEMMLHGNWSLPVDIWAFGIMIFELLTCKSLFVGDCTASRLSSIAERLGQFPTEFLRGCKKSDEYFDTNGSARDAKGAGHGSLEDCLRREVHMTEQDYLATLAFLRKCLSIDPKQRATAAQLLKDDWFPKAL
ncbi:kinase-like domain-containing protein [Earliella scabrosa]|nr:kinase-like domain-containing protein [Earliella scabrosa]